MGRGRGRPRKQVTPSPHRRTPNNPPAQSTPAQSDATVTVVTEDNADDDVPRDETPAQIPLVSDDVSDSDPNCDSTRKLWVDVLSGNRNPANGLAMEFVAPKRVDGEIVVDIEAADVESEVKFWASSLIMYALGGDLSMGAVKQFMIRHWNFVKLPDMFYNEEGYFILRFHSLKDKDVVLMQRPYTIRNMPMLLREW
jgi:hypothetical protein